MPSRLALAHWFGLTLPQQVMMSALFGLGVVNIFLRYVAPFNSCKVPDIQPVKPPWRVATSPAYNGKRAGAGPR